MLSGASARARRANNNSKINKRGGRRRNFISRQDAPAPAAGAPRPGKQMARARPTPQPPAPPTEPGARASRRPGPTPTTNRRASLLAAPPVAPSRAHAPTTQAASWHKPQVVHRRPERLANQAGPGKWRARVPAPSWFGRAPRPSHLSELWRSSGRPAVARAPAACLPPPPARLEFVGLAGTLVTGRARLGYVTTPTS